MLMHTQRPRAIQSYIWWHLQQAKDPVTICSGKNIIIGRFIGILYKVTRRNNGYKYRLLAFFIRLRFSYTNPTLRTSLPPETIFRR